MKTNSLIHRVLAIILLYSMMLNPIYSFANTVRIYPLNQAVIINNNSMLSQYTLPDFVNVGHGQEDFIKVQQDNFVNENSYSVDEIETLFEVSNLNDIRQIAKVANIGNQATTDGFSIGSSNNLVDPFTGDFSYNIPILNVEGYPITLTYNSNIGMLDEASWVGLGWNLNVGAVSRDVRGIPDDFNGEDVVVREYKQKQNLVSGNKYGGYVGLSYSLLNANVSALWGKYTDNYIGVGKTMDLSSSLSGRFGVASNGTMGGLYVAGNLSYGISRDSKAGISSNFGVGISLSGISSANQHTFTYNNDKNTRLGVTAQSVGYNFSRGRMSFSTSKLMIGTQTSIPKINFNMASFTKNSEYKVYTKLGAFGVGVELGLIIQDYNTATTIAPHQEGFRFLSPAYGYYHLGKRSNYRGSYSPIMDFNRNNEAEYSENMKYLPFSIQTYDVYHLNSALGTGIFRPMRSDYGSFYDPNGEFNINRDKDLLFDDSNNSLSLGADLTALPVLGINVGYETGTMKSSIKSGDWTDGAELLKFEPEISGTSFDRSVYFKGIGSVQPVDMTPWVFMNGNIADKYGILNDGDVIKRSNVLIKKNAIAQSSDVNVNNINVLNSSVFSPFTVNDALNLSGVYDANFFYSHLGGNKSAIDRNSNYRKGNHITYIDYINEDGFKLHYGIPVYVFKDVQTTFSVTGRGEHIVNGLPTGLVKYFSADNSIANVLGRNNLFDRNSLPAYAKSFLLTHIFSSDYIDVTNNGPTNDDIGSFYKFNHTLLYGMEGEQSLYGSRFPISGVDSNTKFALLNEGALGSNLDDTGNYNYSLSEVWYTHSVESRNLFVEFILEDRKDAHSANEDGILDPSKPLKLLKEIRVFNKHEREINPLVLPMETFVFYYDYSLCKLSPANLNTYSGVDINNSGKLTLREIRSFVGDSYENSLSVYSFQYGEGDDNPNFSYANIDGWGNYKANSATRKNTLYPYSVQNKEEVDRSARAWKLVLIKNPNGGEINISYESDSYAYVQDKRAMSQVDITYMTDIFDFLKIKKNQNWDGIRMSDGLSMGKNFTKNYISEETFCNVMGVSTAYRNDVKKRLFGSKSNETPYISKHGKLDVNFIPCNVVIFKLDKKLNISSYSENQADNYVLENYFKGVESKPIYSKIYTKVKEGVYDLIPTMSELSTDYISTDAFNGMFRGAITERFKKFGVMPANSNGEYEYGYVIVDLVHTGKREDKGTDLSKGAIAMHPMQIAAMEFSRGALADKIYGTDPNSEGDISIDKKVFWGSAIFEAMMKGGYCASFDTELLASRSFIRLCTPNYVKYGGGSRVKELVFKDNWSSMSGEYDSHYSWEYSYDRSVGQNKISAGVATFEPLIMMDENPLYEWNTYVNIKRKFPDEKVIVNGPIASLLYPHASIGYEHVEVKFKEAQKYGLAINEFYTSKDFPVKMKDVAISDGGISLQGKPISQTNNIGFMVFNDYKEKYGYSQGYITETNDFHGKVKQIATYKYAADGHSLSLISKMVYDYYGLGEKISFIDRLGNVTLSNAALEFDMHVDSKKFVENVNFIMVGISVNTKIFLPFPVFFPIPVPKFHMSSRLRSFYSTVLNKHINYSAVVKSITSEYLGSINKSSNLIFDPHSGESVINQMTDEYNDNLYVVDYPAHWGHKELRDISELRNKSISINLLSDGSFLPNSGNNAELITPGDIIMVDGNEVQVVQLFPMPEDRRLYLFKTNDDVRYYPSNAGTKSIIIKNTARKNRLGELMQSFVTKVNPIINNKLTVPQDNILSCSAITYRDKLTTDCGCDVNLSPGSTYNPYKSGLRGDLIVDRGYSWQSKRNYSDPHGIRFDGAYKGDFVGDDAFVPFYALDNSGIWRSVNHPSHPKYSVNEKYRKWRSSASMELFDQRGNPIQSSDVLNVSSTLIRGYGDRYSNLVYMSAVNAKKHQIGFDGFEDYYGMNSLDAKCRGQKAHFDFYDAVINGSSGAVIDSVYRHSGLYSLKIPALKSLSVSKPITHIECDIYSTVDEFNVKGLQMQPCSCVPTFAPSPGKYLFSAWIRSDNEQPSVIIHAGTATPIHASGPVIDGWRKIEGEFTVQSSANEIKITLVNNTATSDIYFDDIRIHPFLAGVQTSVYDSKWLLPLATHDNENFTTFYGYDENKNLRRVKVETIEGIKTVSESEAGSIKRFLGE